MSRYAGKIGFAEMVETEPGVWEECIVEKEVRGDVVRNNRQLVNSQYLNDDLRLSNSFSVLGNPYIYKNYMNMRYIIWLCEKWKITSVDISNHPRIILEVGGLYNDGQ